MPPAPRNPTCHPPPPPPPPPPTTPKVLLFPRSRRTRRKQPKPKPTSHTRRHPRLLSYSHNYKGRLESLFDRENDDSPILPLDSFNSSSRTSSGAERRERLEGQEKEEEEEVGCGRCINGGGFELEEEKWRFQAEILRAECNFLRLEREFALKKLKNNRIQMETALRSAVQTLVSGREKIFEGKDANEVLVEEIEDLTEKLHDLQKTSRIKDYKIPKCRNMNTEACLLQRPLEKPSEEISSPKEFQEPNYQSSQFINCISPDKDKDHSSSSVSNCKTEINSRDVDVLKKEKAGLSRDELDRSVEEDYSSYVCSAAQNIPVSSSAAEEFLEFSTASTKQRYQEPILHDNKCSGHCKAVIWRIAEQVRAETEQWSQMQEMLRQVRGETEELQASRDFWESQAHSSDYEIQSLRRMVQEWKEKALDYEKKAKELSLELTALKEEEVEKTKAEPHVMQDIEGCEFRNALKELRTEVGNQERLTNYKDFAPPLSLGKQLAKEMKKRMLFHRLKENNSPTRNKNSRLESLNDGKTRPGSKSTGSVMVCSPLWDIGNSNSTRHEKLNLIR